VNLKLVEHEGDECATLDSFLSERIYEFNSAAIARFDEKLFGHAMQDDAGGIVAGVSGHTWAGSCLVTHLWVLESLRGEGLGQRLLQTVETEAMRRACSVVCLSTHSFQSPEFYEHLGYNRQAVIQDHPVGYSNFVYAKRLPRNDV
jgi:GNAT superfamily N-acetyltransferase